jgi:hypothetical protein
MQEDFCTRYIRAVFHPANRATTLTNLVQTMNINRLLTLSLFMAGEIVHRGATQLPSARPIVSRA